ncbi:leucine rich repeat (LRR) protein [Yoonia maricola]|uniref:Leucine rich repeat (LRR) protein n=1 Tax=Yoonia maricola TaxID=420999 RepID=A0A2M8W508_9RHOB|nr:leucine-rich repeat domain-containing protein [Yoonia maricola]PJI86011.1 leucine rich repeat (LRR) protein [Yoonia maricola]
MDIAKILTDQAQSGGGSVTVALPRDMQCNPADLHEIPPAVAEVEGITSVNLGGSSVMDLTPLANLKGLRHLNLSGVPAADFTPLTGLTKLEVLILGDTRIADIGWLEKCKALTTLDLSKTRIADLAPIAACRKLRDLNINATRVSNLAPLAAGSKLRHANLDDTDVGSLAPLAAHTALTDLSASRTPLDDFTPLNALGKLRRLRLDGTDFNDLGLLAPTVMLQWLSLNQTLIADITPLARHYKLTHLYLRGTNVRDILPIATFKLRDLVLDCSQLSDITPLKDNRSLPRIVPDHIGLSFRYTPVTEADPEGFGRVAQLDDGTDLTDALYHLFRTRKGAGPAPALTRAPVPPTPEQTPWLAMHFTDNNFIALQERPLSDADAQAVDLAGLQTLAKDLKTAVWPMRRYNGEDIFTAALHAASDLNPERPKNDWLLFDIHRAKLQPLTDIERVKAEARGKIDPASVTKAVRALIAKLDEILKRNPMPTPITSSDTEQMSEVERAALTSLTETDGYIYGDHSPVFMRHLIREGGPSCVAQAVCRNVIILLASQANGYMVDDPAQRRHSDTAIRWLKKDAAKLTAFAATQEPAFATWFDVTLKNAKAWLISGRPLHGHLNPNPPEERFDHVDLAVWSGHGCPLL